MQSLRYLAVSSQDKHLHNDILSSPNTSKAGHHGGIQTLTKEEVRKVH